MNLQDQFSRREFLAASSAAAAMVTLPGSSPVEAASEEAKLALLGGPKAVAEKAPVLMRWGGPEKEQLNQLIEQDTLFYWKGPKTTLMIERFQKLYPLKHVMTCSSGTAALHIAAAASGLKPGDEVITSPITDMGTVIGAIYQQAVPVFADLVPNTYNLDPADVARKITPKTRAIIAVHLAGNSCDMSSLKTLADQHGLVLIEDCAQSWGGLYRGRPIGTTGHIACFSLQQTKQITCGDGGVVASNDDRFGPLLQRFGDKGYDRAGGNGLFESFATNYRMSEAQAAIAAAQLERVEEISLKRSRLGNMLSAGLEGVSGVVPHYVHPEDRCTFWLYMLRIVPEKLSCDRATFVKALAAEGVQASAGYIPVPLYGNPVFQNHGFFGGHWPVKEFGLTQMDYTQVRCPEAEAILKTGVRIVFHQAMSEDYVASIATAVRKVASHYAV